MFIRSVSAVTLVVAGVVLVGAALTESALAAGATPTPTTPPHTWSSGPSVSSMGPGRVSVFARNGGNFFVSDSTQMPDLNFIARSGWQIIPGATDLVSDPDSATDLWKQIVVGRRPDGDCYYATRDIVISGTAYPAWSAWNRCQPVAMTFDSRIAVAVLNVPGMSRSFLYFFGRRRGTIFSSRLRFENGALVATDTWHALGTTVDDGSLPANVFPADFVGEPAATGWANATKVVVCAPRANQQVYCASFEPALSPWRLMGKPKVGTGPGAAPDLSGFGYEVYHDLTAGADVALRRWLAGWAATLALPAMTVVSPVSPYVPTGPVTSDPDAAVFTDIQTNTLSKKACVRDAGNRIGCSTWNGTSFGPWALEY